MGPGWFAPGFRDSGRITRQKTWPLQATFTVTTLMDHPVRLRRRGVEVLGLAERRTPRFHLRTTRVAPSDLQELESAVSYEES